MNRNWKWVAIIGGLVALVCIACIAIGALGYLQYGKDITTALDTAGGLPTPTVPIVNQPIERATFALGDMQALLKKENGQPCEGNDKLTCIMLTMPLDQFNSSTSKTVKVTFGVLPATGERMGMFLQAYPGGPGGLGISSSKYRIDKFDKKILEHYDLVYFDQRGLGLSSPLTCPNALTENHTTGFSDFDKAGVEGYDTPEEQKKAADGAKEFVEKCVKEIGVLPEELKLYDTKQVVEDIEDFRKAVGDDKFYLYGVSYGTVVGQIYATAHADHLAGLILDGTVDLTLDGVAQDHLQEKGFDTVLVAVLKACNDDPDCSEDFGGSDALKAYDNLAASLSIKPQEFNFPLPDGSKTKRLFTFNKLESVSAFAMYSQAGRTIYLRSLAAAHRGDFVPLVQLLYALLDYDPATEKWVGDPTFSDTAYYLVNCVEDSYFSGTPEERVRAIFKDGQASNGTIPRLDGGVYTGLTCAYWPGAPSQDVRAEPLKAEGVPTFVLDATLDPATPYDGGKAVYEKLADGYLFTIEGGEHGVYGRDNACPDQYITDFLVDSKLPIRREVSCTWDSPVMWSYLQPAAPADKFSDLTFGFYTVDVDLLYSPAHLFNSDEDKEVTSTCPHGGTFTFILHSKTKKEDFTFKDCEFSKGFGMTGTGTFDIDTGDRMYEVDLAGFKTGHLIYDLKNEPFSLTITGTYGGDKISIKRP